MADKQTAEWLRILYPKTWQWRMVKLAETWRDLLFWWVKK